MVQHTLTKFLFCLLKTAPCGTQNSTHFYPARILVSHTKSDTVACDTQRNDAVVHGARMVWPMLGFLSKSIFKVWLLQGCLVSELMLWAQSATSGYITAVTKANYNITQISLFFLLVSLCCPSVLNDTVVCHAEMIQLSVMQKWYSCLSCRNDTVVCHAEMIVVCPTETIQLSVTQK